MTAARVTALVALASLVMAGCSDPYQRSPASARPRPSARHAAGRVATRAQATPRQTVGAFCTQWSNWSWRTIGRQQRRLAALASGGLADQLAAEARSRSQDLSLRRDRVATRGTVVGVDVKESGDRRQAVCVSFEAQQANGHTDVEGARHHVYLATVTRTAKGWAISEWEPQP